MFYDWYIIAALGWFVVQAIYESVYLVATLDAGADLDEAHRLAPEIQELAGSAVDELAHAAEHADLLVVGSRGLKGLKALGSVSERIGHTAACSVLVVRPPAA